MRAMKTRDGRNQAEPKAVSSRLTTAFEPIKTFEHVLVFGSGNSRSIIGNRDNRAAIAARCDLHGYIPVGAAMFDRIVYKIADGVENKIAVTGNTHPLISDKVKMCALFFCSRIVQFHDLTCNLGDVNGPKCNFLRLRLNLSNSGYRGEYAQHTVNIDDGIADQCLVLFAVAPAMIGLLQLSAHTGQWSS